MKVAVDNNILAWLLSDAARPPIHPETGLPIEDGTARLQVIKERINNGDIEPLVVAMPVVGELFSVHANARQDLLPILKDPLVFTLQDFNLRAAIELGDVNNQYYGTSDKRGGQVGSWAKVKADRLIYAIAKSSGAKIMYTDDASLTTVCEANGVTVVHSWDLPLPNDPQRNMFDE